MANDSDVPFDSEADESTEFSILGYPETRRKFIKQVAEQARQLRSARIF